MNLVVERAEIIQQAGNGNHKNVQAEFIYWFHSFGF